MPVSFDKSCLLVICNLHISLQGRPWNGGIVSIIKDASHHRSHMWVCPKILDGQGIEPTATSKTQSTEEEVLDLPCLERVSLCTRFLLNFNITVLHLSWKPFLLLIVTKFSGKFWMRLDSSCPIMLTDESTKVVENLLAKSVHVTILFLH